MGAHSGSSQQYPSRPTAAVAEDHRISSLSIEEPRRTRQEANCAATLDLPALAAPGPTPKGAPNACARAHAFGAYEFLVPGAVREEFVQRNAKDWEAFLREMDPAETQTSQRGLSGPFFVPGGGRVPSETPLLLGKVRWPAEGIPRRGDPGTRLTAIGRETSLVYLRVEGPGITVPGGASLRPPGTALKEFGSPLGENDPGRLVRTDVPVGHPEVRPWRAALRSRPYPCVLLTARCLRTRVVLAIAS